MSDKKFIYRYISCADTTHTFHSGDTDRVLTVDNGPGIY